MKPLSICMFSNLFPPVVSGSSTQSFMLSVELVQRGTPVTVITAKIKADQPEQETIKGVRIHRLPALRLPKMPIALNFPWLNYTYTPGNQKRIQTILTQEAADVYHLHNHMFDLAFSAVGAARRNNKPLLVTLHTVIKHPHPVFDALLHPVDRVFLKKFVIDKADTVICPEATIQGYAEDAFNRRENALVPYGITPPPDVPRNQVDELRRKYNLGASPVILSMGHVHEIRNRRELVEAMPLILKEFPDVKLLIVGAIGTNTPQLTARKLGIESSVVFTGAVPHDQIPVHLALGDIEAHWFQKDNPQYKTLGIAALEAMGSGKVVFGTADEDVYGKGVLKNNTNVILVDPPDPNTVAAKIISLLKDPQRTRMIGDEAKITIRKHFSWDSVCERTLQVYREAIEKVEREKAK
jgi:1,2-diacylglycerol 3-alpha-glucosyltransferase